MPEEARSETAAAVPAPAPAPSPAAETATPKLQIENLTLVYPGRTGKPVHAVDDVSLTIEDKPGCGEIVVFLGPSGCGKSTILKCVAGLLTPTKGRVLADGKLVEGPSRERGMVFQQYTSFAWLTIQENVEYGLKLAGVAKGERRDRAQKVLEQVGLSDFAPRYPKELSGGMKQRVAIARTLVNKPRLVLMDEPFGALDPPTRWGMQSLLLDISKTADNTILFVTHDVSEAVYLADTVYVMSQRPAKILHTIQVPAFKDRDLSLKQKPEFRQVEDKLLQLLHGQLGSVRIG